MKVSKIKFNVLDISILFVLIFIIIGSAVRIQFKNSVFFATGKKEAVITIETIDKHKTLSTAVHLDDYIKIEGSIKELGKITAVVNRNNKKYVPTLTGYEEVFTDDLYRVLIKAKSNVYVNENGTFTVDNKFIAPGLKLTFESDNAVFEGTITDISFK